MHDLSFNADHLGENTLTGYGFFTPVLGGEEYPRLHFLAMVCETTKCSYVINLETGISFKAGASADYVCEDKAISGMLRSVCEFLKARVSSREDRSKLVDLAMQPGSELFWNQFHKIRILYPEKDSMNAEGLSQLVTAAVSASCQDMKLNDFIYRRPKKDV